MQQERIPNHQNSQELFERQNKTLMELLDVINPENGQALITVYRELVEKQPRHTLFDASDPSELSRFSDLTEKKHEGLVGRVSMDPDLEGESWVPFLTEFTKSFGIDIEKEFTGNVATTVVHKAGTQRIISFIDGIDRLSPPTQQRLVVVLKNIESIIKRHPNESRWNPFQVYASTYLKPHERTLLPELQHFFLTVDEADESKEFSERRTRDLMGSFYSAFSELIQKKSVTLSLPHKTGKTTIRKTLQILLPGYLVDINASEHLGRKGFKMTDLVFNTGSGIGLVDHAHLFQRTPEIESKIVERLGKTIFVETVEQ